MSKESKIEPTSPSASATSHLPFRSLAAQTMISMAIRITIIVTVSTGAAYWHMNQILTEKHLQNLSKYVQERGGREAALFALAQSNHDTMRPRLAEALAVTAPLDYEAEFAKFFEQRPDGTWRDKPGNDIHNQPTLYHGTQSPMTPELMRTLVIGREFVRRYGQAYEKQFADTYITTPENSMLMYWPGLNWGGDAPSDLDMRKEEYIWVADAKNNPLRKTQWTGMYFDVAAKQWMLSIETPHYSGERLVATIGHDILLTEMLDRAVSTKLEGTKNIVLRADGRLIAHEDFTESIKESNGDLNVTKAEKQTGGLKDLYDMLNAEPSARRVLYDAKREVYFGHHFIPGPNWHFVVEYPKRLVTNQAIAAARIILLLGVLSLIGELFVLFYIIRKNVALPLKELNTTTSRVAAGDFQVRSTLKRGDELGHLSLAFNSMLDVIADRDAQLRNYAHDLEVKVEERTAAVERQRAQIMSSSKMASLGVMAGGIAHEINNPLAVIHGRAHQLQRFASSDRLTKPALIEIADVIVNTSERIASIVRGLRTFARDGASDPLLPVKCGTVLLESVALCSERFRAKSIALEVLIKDPEAVILCRQVEISQVIVNLLSNAFDAVSGQQDSWVRLIVEASGDLVLIRVRDSGKGIPQDIVDKIMTPFFTTKESGKGTGLGLSISFRIIEAHKGRLFVNQQCADTEFVIEFPREVLVPTRLESAA